MAYGTVNADLMTTSDGVSSSGLYGFKNRILNGQMVIDQRNAGASVTVTNANPVYTLDRWGAYASVTSKYTAQQNAGSVSVLGTTGFSNYLGITSSAATSVGASDFYFLNQPIEVCNISDLAYGTASAKATTLSFWVYSSLTGSFGGAIRNTANNKSYVFSYTVSSANTWTYITLTIPGDTSTAISTTYNATGLWLVFSLGMGSNNTTTNTGTWVTGGYNAPNSTVSVVGTNGATFYLTGVQLEKGSTATSFDYRPYGTELQLCQRYYEVVNATLGAYVDNGAVDNVRFYIAFKVTKRANPTVTSGSGGSESGGTWTPAYSGVDVNGTNCASSIGSTITRPYINAPIIASIEL